MKRDWHAIGEKLWERSDGHCERCGREIDVLRYENVHHKKKRSAGGIETLPDTELLCGPMMFWGKKDDSCHTWKHHHPEAARLEEQML